LDEILQREMRSALWRNAERIPRCASVHADLATLGRFFEHRERRPQTIPKFGARHRSELLTGVVDVVHVDRSEAEVLSTLGETVAKETRRQAVSTCHDFFRSNHLLVDELALHVRLIFFARRWRLAVERDISALGADNELLS